MLTDLKCLWEFFLLRFLEEWDFFVWLRSFFLHFVVVVVLVDVVVIFLFFPIKLCSFLQKEEEENV